MLSSSPWKTNSTRIVYQNPWLTVQEDQVTTPAGKPGMYAFVTTRGPAVYVIALTPDKKIHWVNLYRYPQSAYSWELPAGNSDGQPVLDAAKRELQEETGLQASSWQELGKFVSCSGIVKEWCHVFLAQGLTQTNQHQQAEEGIASSAIFSMAEIIAMQAKGEFVDGLSMSALWLAQKTLSS